jgi:hypothetical protein
VIHYIHRNNRRLNLYCILCDLDENRMIRKVDYCEKQRCFLNLSYLQLFDLKIKLLEINIVYTFMSTVYLFNIGNVRWYKIRERQQFNKIYRL